MFVLDVGSLIVVGATHVRMLSFLLPHVFVSRCLFFFKLYTLSHSMGKMSRGICIWASVLMDDYDQQDTTALGAAWAIVNTMINAHAQFIAGVLWLFVCMCACVCVCLCV